MKILAFTVTLLLSSNVFSQDVVKSCKTKLSMPGMEEVYDTNMTIIKKGEGLIVHTRQTDPATGEVKEFDEKVEVAEFDIRTDLYDLVSNNQDDYDVIAQFNAGESYVSHAMHLETDPVFEGKFSSGIDLKNVRHTKVYLIGKATHMGQGAIVEAYDENNVVMGSYLGGFLVLPCLQ